MYSLQGNTVRQYILIGVHTLGYLIECRANLPEVRRAMEWQLQRLGNDDVVLLSH